MAEESRQAQVHRFRRQRKIQTNEILHVPRPGKKRLDRVQRARRAADRAGAGREPQAGRRNDPLGRLRRVRADRVRGVPRNSQGRQGQRPDLQILQRPDRRQADQGLQSPSLPVSGQHLPPADDHERLHVQRLEEERKRRAHNEGLRPVHLIQQAAQVNHRRVPLIRRQGSFPQIQKDLRRVDRQTEMIN